MDDRKHDFEGDMDDKDDQGDKDDKDNIDKDKKDYMDDQDDKDIKKSFGVSLILMIFRICQIPRLLQGSAIGQSRR